MFNCVIGLQTVVSTQHYHRFVYLLYCVVLCCIVLIQIYAFEFLYEGWGQAKYLSVACPKAKQFNKLLKKYQLNSFVRQMILFVKGKALTINGLKALSLSPYHIMNTHSFQIQHNFSQVCSLNIWCCFCWHHVIIHISMEMKHILFFET